MTTLYTLAYPTLSDADRAWIDQQRAAHDQRFVNVVAPHFTMVFRCEAILEDAYCAWVSTVVSAQSAIPFTCRYAMLGADDADDTAYAFLVPDEGYSGISRLHDALYRGPLQPYLKLGIPYVPHITVGTFTDRVTAKDVCDAQNASNRIIRGSIDALTVGVLENGKIMNIAEFRLTTA